MTDEADADDVDLRVGDIIRIPMATVMASVDGVEQTIVVSVEGDSCIVIRTGVDHSVGLEYAQAQALASALLHAMGLVHRAHRVGYQLFDEMKQHVAQKNREVERLKELVATLSPRAD